MTQIQRGNWVEEKIDLLKSELVRDDVVDGWFLMGSFQPVFWIVVAYLFFVLKLGPKIMESRKPLKIKKLIIAYDLFQVLFNGWLVWLLFSTPGSMTYAKEHMCKPLGRRNNPYFLPVLTGGWYYFMSKVNDLLDTVFFVLRKQQSHVSFLHVFHHVNMLILTWMFLKYMKDEHAVLAGALNAFVHVWMYGYYFLAALGPSVQKHLWWKKHVTQLQISHFVIIIAYMGVLLWSRCEMLISLAIYIAITASVFLYLFTKFYFETYSKSKKVGAGEVKNKRTLHFD
nr:PREDICTED: elongation of very long chain fatty acids protein AAEL008004-like [Bemisia tabaci]XP_018902196.1 PREDICTED: elongation of very long chain fatty acids protein AAEL008004-like [Bemisia tabaci]